MKILLWPNASLKKVCDPVVFPDPDAQGQLDEMKKVMLASDGLGLAANQVGINKRMLVAKGPTGIRYFINPRIVTFAGQWRNDFKEGCLSLPGIVVPTRRNTSIMVEHEDLETGTLRVEVFGPTEGSALLAHILQHEIDHLDGKVMIDGLPGAQRDKVRAYMRTVRR